MHDSHDKLSLGYPPHTRPELLKLVLTNLNSIIINNFFLSLFRHLLSILIAYFTINWTQRETYSRHTHIIVQLTALAHVQNPRVIIDMVYHIRTYTHTHAICIHYTHTHITHDMHLHIRWSNDVRAHRRYDCRYSLGAKNVV